MVLAVIIGHRPGSRLSAHLRTQSYVWNSWRKQWVMEIVIVLTLVKLTLFSLVQVATFFLFLKQEIAELIGVVPAY